LDHGVIQALGSVTCGRLPGVRETRLAPQSRQFRAFGGALALGRDARGICLACTRAWRIGTGNVISQGSAGCLTGHQGVASSWTDVYYQQNC